MQNRLRHSGMGLGSALTMAGGISTSRYWTKLKTIAVDNTGNASTLTNWYIVLILGLEKLGKKVLKYFYNIMMRKVLYC